MGTVADSLQVIKELIRDEDGKAFSDAYLLRLYNNARRQLFKDTELRVRATVLSSPPTKWRAVTNYWERGFVSTQSWLPFYSSQGGYACTQVWEQEWLAGRTGLSDGGWFMTSSIEWAFQTPAAPFDYNLPEDCDRILWMGYAGRELEQKSQKWLANYDSQWKTRSGTPYYFFLGSQIQKVFFPYPRPITDSSTAVTVQQLDVEDQGEEALVGEGFALFFVSMPTDLTGGTDSQVPRPFRKYIEFLAASTALKAETEFREPKKADFLKQRYKFGVTLIGQLKQSLRRDLRLTKAVMGQGARTSMPGRPRFPDHYPPAWT